MLKAVVFDIGQTLVEYNKPLNWSALYRPALESACGHCGYAPSNRQYQRAVQVLARYNTRSHPRDREVSSNRIFSEILRDMELPAEALERMKFHFYSYFRQDAAVFPEVEETLKKLSGKGILLGTLSDVAYGMDNVYALEDIGAIIKYIDHPITSNDTGCRKPRPEGLIYLAKKMKAAPEELAFVGDEEKDVRCALNAGAYSVLINRGGGGRDYGQNLKISSLAELLMLFP